MRLATQCNDAGSTDARVVADHRGKTVIGLAHFFFDGALAGERESAAAVFLGDGEPEQPHLTRELHQVIGDGIGFLDLARTRIDFLAQETGDFVGKCAFFGRVGNTHWITSTVGFNYFTAKNIKIFFSHR